MKNKKMPFIIIGILILALLVVVNAISVNPKQLKADERIIKSEKISEDIKGNIIIFFSDLHYSDINKDKLDKLSTLIKKYDPSLVIFGGDLSDIELDDDESSDLKTCLSDIKGKYGKLAIRGDEDDDSEVELLESCGFRFIENETAEIYFGGSGKIEVTNGETYRDPSIFTLDIAHFGDDLKDGDLLIGGHSLGGQIYLPLVNFLYREEGSEKYYHGTYKKNGSPLIISNGVGGKEKGTRFLADAEITVIRID